MSNFICDLIDDNYELEIKPDGSCDQCMYSKWADRYWSGTITCLKSMGGFNCSRYYPDKPCNFFASRDLVKKDNDGLIMVTCIFSLCLILWIISLFLK